MASWAFQVAVLIFGASGATVAGEAERPAGEGATAGASALPRVAPQRAGPDAQLVRAQLVEAELGVGRKAADGLWELFKANGQCGKWKDAQDKYGGVSSPEECQALAIANGHAFFTYKASKKQCQTSEDCDDERGGSGWKIYAAPAPAEDGCVVSSVTVFTGSNPAQISWKIAGQTSDGEMQHCVGEDYTSAHEEVTVDCCLSSGTFLLSCNDFSGNGMGDGYVEVGGHRIFKSWSGFRKDETVTMLQPASDAGSGCAVSTLRVHTGSSPTQMYWKIVGKPEGDGMVICESDAHSTPNDVLTTDCCLSPGAYLLSCVDDSGDGWSGGFIEFGGHRFCDSWTGFGKDVLLIV